MPGLQQLNKIEHHHTHLVCEWEFVEIEDTYSRIYYKSKDAGQGFYFYILEVQEHVHEIWESTAMVLCHFKGEGYFDGIRHMEVGEDGYIYCPNLTTLTQALVALKELEIKYCPQL